MALQSGQEPVPSLHDGALPLGYQTRLVHDDQPSLRATNKIMPIGLVGLMAAVAETQLVGDCEVRSPLQKIDEHPEIIRPVYAAVQ
jgi:hypothetical protein